jgi:hypothetical protein
MLNPPRVFKKPGAVHIQPPSNGEGYNSAELPDEIEQRPCHREGLSLRPSSRAPRNVAWVAKEFHYVHSVAAS